MSNHTLLYDWPYIRQCYEQGERYTALHVRLGFSHGAWAKAIKRGDIAPIARQFKPRPPRKTDSRDPASVGERTEAIILADLLKAGHRVLIPFGHSHKYDLAIDVDGRLVRVQCKTARITNGAVCFNSCASRSRQSYIGAADVFAVFCPENSKIYFVPVHAVGHSAVNLRVADTVNKQILRIRMAGDYETLDLSALARRSTN